MRIEMKRALIFVLALSLALALAGCGKSEEPDPHEGMIQVNIGSELAWVPLLEDIPASDFRPGDFGEENGRVTYKGDGYDVSLGIDVSIHQGDIDWQAVKADGVDFAIIQCGYRGYTEGNMYECPNFKTNIEGALDAGLQVGVYFFSQATGALEAAEEAKLVLDIIEGYDITLPVCFDWETLDGSRVLGTGTEDVTGAAVVFCEMIRDAGYTPCVYFSRNMGYYLYDLSRISEYTFWLASPGNLPDFYYAHAIWQFTFEGEVDGIGGAVDMNLRFVPRVTEEDIPAAA